MVDFDELRSKAEAVAKEHGDQIDKGIDGLADLAGKRFGHGGQIEQTADKLKGFVDEQNARPAGPREGKPRPRPAGQQGARRDGQKRPQPGAKRGPRSAPS